MMKTIFNEPLMAFFIAYVLSFEYNKNRYTKSHLLEARIENFSTWVHYSSDKALKTELTQLLEEAEFTILNFIEHSFTPQGYTALWLLAESHCALHTFPEESKAYIELSSCNVQMYTNFIILFNKKYHQIENPT